MPSGRSNPHHGIGDCSLAPGAHLPWARVPGSAGVVAHSAPRSDIIFVTNVPVTFFLNVSKRDVFYLFFMQLVDFFVTALWGLDRIYLSVR